MALIRVIFKLGTVPRLPQRTFKTFPLLCYTSLWKLAWTTQYNSNSFKGGTFFFNLIWSIYDLVPGITTRSQTHHASKTVCWLKNKQNKYISLRGYFLNIPCEEGFCHWMPLRGRKHGAGTFLGEISPSLQCAKCWVIERKKNNSNKIQPKCSQSAV